MRLKQIAFAIAIGLLVSQGAARIAAAQDQPPASDSSKTKSAANDREIMQKIRKSVVGDKSLSTYAHNVKIVSEHGGVILKGPVRSEEEKTKIVQMATDVAGAGNVTDQMTIVPEKNKK